MMFKITFVVDNAEISFILFLGSFPFPRGNIVLTINLLEFLTVKNNVSCRFYVNVLYPVEKVPFYS